MAAETRLVAAVNTVVDNIIIGTGIRIRQPPLKNENDCTVRVSGDKTLSQTLNRVHAEREVRLTIYCKSDDARAGIDRLTKIQDYISETVFPENGNVCIQSVTAGEISEMNDYGEWIYTMLVTIKYCY